MYLGARAAMDDSSPSTSTSWAMFSTDGSSRLMLGAVKGTSQNGKFEKKFLVN